MLSDSRLAELVRLHAPPSVARAAKRAGARLRHASRLRAARQAYARHGERYPHPLLFIAGLPKSGTTWLERMLSSYEGFELVLPVSITRHEMRAGRSHDFDLPDDFFAELAGALAVAKTHVPGSPANVALLRRHQLPHVVVQRDLRDVAVSHYFYVRSTSWHPEHPHYRGLSPREGLRVFLRRDLPSFAAWVRSWQENADTGLTRVIRYEDMLAEPVATMTAVARHYGLDSSEPTVRRVVERHSFSRLSGGRGRGDDEGAGTSFFRRGVAGDWRNHFDSALRADYQDALGGLLEELGYPAWENEG